MSDFIDPRGLTFDEWTDELDNSYSSFDVPSGFEELRWRDFALEVITSNQGFDIPFPNTFATWQDWAVEVMRVLS